MMIEQKRVTSITHDGTVRLAVGSSRNTKKWKNKEMSWSELVNKLAVTTRTRETIAQYRGMSRDDKGAIKDVGGFVGGVLKEGRRKKGQVAWRSLITLDVDFGTPGLWEQIELLYGNAIVMYSTHSHTENQPKVRLIIPLARQVTADEYKALSRFVAAEIGIEIFDDTTYQPERLMYWPSTSEDATYVFEMIDGPWMDPDYIFNKRPDWRDASTWPESSRAHKFRESSAEKQGDPTEKPGLIGAFCRTYSVPEAMDTLLSDVYEHCDVPDRYTYIEGSASAGVIIYNDLFSFSHHGTDPTGGILCNAFDLVRIHKFGLMDEDAKEDTPVSKLPSYAAMNAYVLKDTECRIELANTKAAEVTEDFGEAIEDENAWKARLQYSDKGSILQTINNMVLVLRHDKHLKDRIAIDEFTRSLKLRYSMPWRAITSIGAWSDSDDANLRHYLEAVYGLKKREAISDATQIIMKENGYHPITEYLDNLTWDGVERIDTMLIDFLGVEDSVYTRAISRKWITAGAARVRDPGVKFDNMLILVGPQGVGKSQFFSRISRSSAWFSDSMSKFDNSKDSMEQLAGKWIIELGELSAMKRHEVEHVKVFLSKQEDSYRPSYGKRTETYPRQCIFGGTTNNDDFLQDVTGARRFWPVRVGNLSCMWNDMDHSTVDQLWAEADIANMLGEELYIKGEAERQAVVLQEQFTEVGGKVGAAEEFLDRQLPVNWTEKSLSDKVNWLNGFMMGDAKKDNLVDRIHISGIELYVECFNGRIDTFNRKESYEMRDILSYLGWSRHGKTKVIKGYGKQRIYSRKISAKL